MTGRILLSAAALSAFFILRASAQDISLDVFSQLTAKAAGHMEVNLDGALLQLGAGFLSGKDPDEARAKNLVAGLKGIYVRNYTFAKAGEYSMADVERVRAQLKGWK